MKGLNYSSVICLLLGIIAIIYGWTQTWEANFDQYLERTVRSYVFTVGGIILIIMSFIVDQVIKALKNK